MAKTTLSITPADRLIIESWKTDWNNFSRDVLKVRLDNKQQEILSAIQHNRRVSICSGTARGKDFLAATASICFLYLTPYFDEKGILHTSTVINTGPSDRQVKNIMMREVKSRIKGSILPKLARYGFNSGRTLIDGIKFDIPKDMAGEAKYANIEKWYLLAFKADDNNQEVWTGFHNENIMIVATEATGLKQNIFDGIEGCLQGNSRFVIVFNPNHTNGEAFSSARDPQYKFFKLSSLESPNVELGMKLNAGLITLDEFNENRIPGQVDYEWVKEHIHKKGWTMRISEPEIDKSKLDFQFEGQWFRPSNICRVKILGEFPTASDDTLIPLFWIDQAMERWKKRKIEGGIRAVDVAGMGSDNTVIVDRLEWYVDELQTVGYTNPETVHMEIAGRLKEDGWKSEFVLIDTIGEGAGVYSRLAEQNVNNIVKFKASYGANGLTDYTKTRKFANMRSYCYWMLRDWLDPQFDSKAELPPSDELRLQLSEMKFKVMSNGTIIIEPKDELRKRIGGSPDEADSLSMTFAPISRLITSKPAGPRVRFGSL